MKKINILLLLLVCIPAVLAIPIPDKSYFVTTHYRAGIITAASAVAKIGYAPDRIIPSSDGYKFMLQDYHGRKLFSTFFTIRSYAEVFPLAAEHGIRRVAMDDFDHLELIPYYTQGRTIEVYNPDGTKVHTIDVSQFALCNQNCVCDGRETYENCPEDCAEQQTQGTTEKRLDIAVTAGWNLLSFRGKTKLSIQPTEVYKYHEGTWLPINCIELLGGTYLMRFDQAGTVTARIQECP